jgi:sugar (pentulose or hexulose) kinase
MPGAAVPTAIAVLDIGKSNLKLLVASDDGWPIETLSIPNAATTSDRYFSYDLAALEAWLLDALAEVARRFSIGAVVASAHGCSAVLTDGRSAVLPMMDYEAVSPPIQRCAR